MKVLGAIVTLRRLTLLLTVRSDCIESLERYAEVCDGV